MLNTVFFIMSYLFLMALLLGLCVGATYLYLYLKPWARKEHKKLVKKYKRFRRKYLMPSYNLGSVKIPVWGRVILGFLSAFGYVLVFRSYF